MSKHDGLPSPKKWRVAHPQAVGDLLSRYRIVNRPKGTSLNRLGTDALDMLSNEGYLVVKALR